MIKISYRGKYNIGIHPKHIIPWIFIALAVWVAISVPGEGVEAWQSIGDSNFINRTYASIGTYGSASWDLGYMYYNGTGNYLADLTGSGTLQDFEFQFASSYTGHAGTTQSLFMISNVTVSSMLSNSVTRLVLSFSWTDLGTVNHNITQVLIGSAATTGAFTVMHTYIPTYEIQINDSSTVTITTAWTYAVLSTFAASHSAEYCMIRIVMDNGAFCYASEVWSGSAYLQYSDISKSQTWIYSILGSCGFLVGTAFLMPVAGLGDNFLSRGRRYYRKQRRYRRRRNRRNYYPRRFT